MKVSLRRVGAASFEATNAGGQRCVLDGPPDLGGTGAGLRPMELVLTGLAGCSALDVVLILKKQRQGLEDLDIEVEGERADAVPAVFTHIHLRFTASGAVDPEKLRRAVDMSMETYCSVARMLQPGVRITTETAVRAGSTP
jgi:putative redox protein